MTQKIVLIVVMSMACIVWAEPEPENKWPLLLQEGSSHLTINVADNIPDDHYLTNDVDRCYHFSDLFSVLEDERVIGGI